MRRSSYRTLLPTTALAAAGLLALPAATSATVSPASSPGAAAHAVSACTSQRDPQRDPRIVNGETYRCLDSNYNGNVYTLPCNNGHFQNWILDTGPSPRRPALR